MHPPPNLPPPIRTDGSNAFAYHTMRYRHAQMLDRLLEDHPDYADLVTEELLYLRDSLTRNAAVEPLNLFPTPPPDYIQWTSAFIEQRERDGNESRWQDTGWFFAETYLFRLIIEATRWWEHGEDPFAPIKQREMNTPALWQRLDAALQLDGGVYNRLPTLIKMATWGNRIDLSYAASMERGTETKDDDLLVDDSDTAAAHMLRAQLTMFPGRDQGITHVIADNAGTELVLDLALVDALLSAFSDVVILHVKVHPTFVSDATAQDVRQTIDRFADGPHGEQPLESVTALGARLRDALHNGRLRLAPHFFWNSSDFLWQIPSVLARVFESAQLVIMKGDANYRRAVGDAIWDTTTPFQDVVSYFPAPLLALRTLKSDPVIGLPAGMAERLDAEDAEWRINGQRAVIQLSS